MSEEALLVPLSSIEGTHLVNLLDEFRELLSTEIMGDGPHDPGLARLTPNPYPDDAEAAQSFTAVTREELLDRRSADAAVVRASLFSFAVDPSDLEDDEVLASHQVIIPESEIDAWMRTLTALRLVIAARLGIAHEDTIDDEDPRRGVYDWLGYRLDTLIDAADALI
ncbi:DUF2017 family protein [Microbacterium sp. A93]|uniref:DUF2017 family protein n=1 Tax=unclassified Microbacterium TaxID=2609290 RepID=UPI003F43CCB7